MTSERLDVVVRRQAGPVLVGAAVLLLAFNLRPAVTSLGAVLDDVRDGFGLSATAAGVLTTLPVVCFAAFGAVAPRLARRFGTSRVIAASVAAIALGLIARAVTGSEAVFVVMTAVALAGMATGNVLLPAIVKAYYPHALGRMTGLYTTSIAIGTTLAAALTVPIGDLDGGWRGGLLLWGATAAVALVPWLSIARTEPGRPVADPVDRGVASGLRMSRKPVAWALAVYGATGGWAAPIGLLIALLIPQLVAGWIAARPGCVDDDISEATDYGHPRRQ